MTRLYVRAIGILLVAYGLAGIGISDISGWVRFDWLEITISISAGLAALWLGFRRSLVPMSLRAARVYALTLIAVAVFGLWGPIIPKATLEPAEMALWALAGIVGLIIVLREDVPAVVEPAALDAPDRS